MIHLRDISMLSLLGVTTPLTKSEEINSVCSQSERQEQIQRNRHYMKTVLNILKFYFFQEIALRGHREVDSAANKGNFLELLNLVSEHHPVVKARWSQECYLHFT
uniref:Uncharacterized protein n=1 Tax=Amphimedon queenslandica TaxID=400682 RepID=A0A1X7SM68_AMPQE